ncbi:MAG TPA: GGDEF domain-containing protein [Burkholderiaceae bacterium]|jgi:diguanylate cyclase (GGDEF)-like protein
MPEVVDHLAELTGQRDRDVVDMSLVSALNDLLEPLSVAIYRCLGEPGDQRWLTCASLKAGEEIASSDSLWADPDSLPSREERPSLSECLEHHGVVSSRVKPPGGKGAPCWSATFPLVIEGEVQAVLEVVTRGKLKVESQRMVSSMLRIYHNFQGLLESSERDTLTGLLNRKTFDDRFQKALRGRAVPARDDAVVDGRRSQGQARHFLGVIDIDHFKQVNDRFGHLIGDEVLLLLSRLMRQSFRFYDSLYRFGGEEFVVMMRCDDLAAAGMAFERLRARCEAFAFPQIGSLTISIGFTEIRRVDSPSEAFQRADEAVYYAKGHGRNQVARHAALVASGELKEREQTNAFELF